MINKEAIKTLFINLNWKDIKILKKIKTQIKKNQREIKFENIDLVELKNKDLFNEYIMLLSKRYPNAKFSFYNSSIDGINLKLDSDLNITFNKCYITNLKIVSDNNNTVILNNCKLIYCDIEKNEVSIKTNKVEMNECDIDLKINGAHLLELGNGINSSVSINDNYIKNYPNIPFNIYICSETLRLNNYNSPDNVKLVVSCGNEPINYINILNSKVMFNENVSVNSNMILSENSSINNLSAESESIEIVDNCTFINSNIVANNFVLDGDTFLNIINTDLNVNYLECSENSTINDSTNKFCWFKKIKSFYANKGFNFKYNNEVIFSKETNEEIIEDGILEEVKVDIEQKVRRKK